MYRVLIADDELIERKVLYKTLTENLGDQCAIFQAENGREALAVYEKEKIQIAILDIEMPGINGIEAAQKIREQDADCSIIFLTAYDEFSYARKAITVRALDYLLKPYDEQELMLVMEEAMRLTEERMKARAAREQRNAQSQDGDGITGDVFAQEGRGEEAAESAGEKAAGTEAAAGTEFGIPDLLREDSEDFGSIRLSKVTELIDKYIRENYMYDISMQDLARTMNYSEAYFCKLFKQCFNKNFTSYLTEFRVEAAKKLLKEPTVNVKEIGKAVGYGDSNYFAKVFKRITGQSPTEYRMYIFQNL